MIKAKFFIAIVMGAAALLPIVPSTAHGAGLSIEIGDRPYYNRGSYYVEHGRRWEWVPGHWSWRHHHRVWIHGHYRRR